MDSDSTNPEFFWNNVLEDNYKLRKVLAELLELSRSLAVAKIERSALDENNILNKQDVWKKAERLLEGK